MALAFLSTCWQYSRKAGELAWEKGTPHQHSGDSHPQPQTSHPSTHLFEGHSHSSNGVVVGSPLQGGEH